MKKLKELILKTLLPTGVLLSLVLISLSPISCKSNTDENDNSNFIEADISVPKFEKIHTISEDEILLYFSKKINALDLKVFYLSENGNVNLEIESNFFEEESNCLSIKLKNSTEIGKEYIIETYVVDDSGNSLKLKCPFYGYNYLIPNLIISELRNSYGTSTSNGITTHKSEFVELYALSHGNLSGLELISVTDGKEKSFRLPSINVKKGDYITVHMRTIVSDTIDGEGMINELGDDLTLSTHTDSNDLARDLWSENTKACFADSDIILLRNINNEEISDCLVYAKSNLLSWNETLQKTAMEIENLGLWKDSSGENSCSINSAVSSDNISSSACTRSFSRQNISEIEDAYDLWLKDMSKLDSKFIPFNSKNVWMITADKGSGKSKIIGVTPGSKNSSNEYKS